MRSAERKHYLDLLNEHKSNLKKTLADTQKGS